LTEKKAMLKSRFAIAQVPTPRAMAQSADPKGHRHFNQEQNEDDL
jgi:hypothetical protein